MRKLRFPTTLILLLAAGSAMAHPGHPSSSYFSGFLHPLGGLDHLLAMGAVGFFAARQGGRSRWVLPMGFILAMLVGAALEAGGMVMPWAETGIASSVVILGLLIATVARWPLLAALPLVVAFAVIHGYVHLAEAQGGDILAFTAGFAAMSGLLQGAGYLTGQWLPESAWGRLCQKVIGSALAVAGGLLFVA